MRAAPNGLHGRVMIEVIHTRPAAKSAGSVGAGWLKVAACLALLGGAAWSVETWTEWTEHALEHSARSEATGPHGLGWADPAPALIPSARTISVSLQQPLMNEAQSVLDDTRRAADFVVSCLPFTATAGR